MHTNTHCLQGLLNYVNHMFSDTIQKSVKKISNFFSRHNKCVGILTVQGLTRMTEPKASVVWPIIQSNLQYENMVMLRARLCLNCCRKIRPNKNITNRGGGVGFAPFRTYPSFPCLQLGIVMKLINTRC